MTVPEVSWVISLYTEIGATAGNSILTDNPTELAKFSDVHADPYWSGNEYGGLPSDAYGFYFQDGLQYKFDKLNQYYAWAVRDGDVAAAVPEPGSLMLLGAGLIGWLGGTQRRQG